MYIEFPVTFFQFNGIEIGCNCFYPARVSYQDDRICQVFRLQGIMQMLNGNYTEAENLLRKAEEAGLPQASENLKILHAVSYTQQMCIRDRNISGFGRSRTIKIAQLLVPIFHFG